ncbi:MAG TPA: HAD family hydrolase [Ktedonobacterales bacterium]|nr:HAD family hydrolase [Ktedonobacterales bacterium]
MTSGERKVEATMASDMSAGDPHVVFILDCDNTLLDNDAVKADYDAGLRALLGESLIGRFWAVYEEVRALTGMVDFPLTLTRFRPLCPDGALFERATTLIMEYPFATRLYPAALDTLRHLREIGTPAIVSDGDHRYQPMKIERSGLLAAVEGRVLIYVHKEDHLETIFHQWPASFYVIVDDKARILSATKALFPHRFATVHVRQGHYGTEPITTSPPPDLSIASIGDLRQLGVRDFARYVSGQ